MRWLIMVMVLGLSGGVLHAETLTKKEKKYVRQELERYAHRQNIPVSWTKEAVDLAAQEIEDLLSGTTVILPKDVEPAGQNLNVITKDYVNAATVATGTTFTAGELQNIHASVCFLKAERDRGK